MKIASAQSLVETVIAAGLIAIGIVAAMSLSTRSEAQTNYAKQLAEANRYAVQAQDWYRTNRTYHGWSAITAKIVADAGANTATYCLTSTPSDPDEFFSIGAGTCDATDLIPNTRFTRQVTVNTARVDEGILSLTISISWPDKTTRTTNLEMELTKWQ